MNTIQISIFDAYGKIRSDLESEAATIEALPDDVRAKLFACIETVTARDAGQDRVAAARSATRQKSAVYDAALLKDQTENSAETFSSALMATVAAGAGRSPEPPVKLNKKTNKLEPLKINKKTRAALAEADLALTEARSELTRATSELRTLESKAGEAINAWRKCLTTPSADEVTREYLAASQAERARRVAAGLPADAQKEIPAHRWEIERVFAARGKVSANRQPKYLGPVPKGRG